MFERVLAAVRKIPKGKVATYGDVAAASGYPGAARQVVWALRSGGKAVPWHRVLGAKGKIRLTGENGFEQRAAAALGRRRHCAATAVGSRSNTATSLNPRE